MSGSRAPRSSCDRRASRRFEAVERGIGEHADRRLDAALDGGEVLLDGSDVGHTAVFVAAHRRLHEPVDRGSGPVVVAQQDVPQAPDHEHVEPGREGRPRVPVVSPGRDAPDRGGGRHR